MKFHRRPRFECNSQNICLYATEPARPLQIIVCTRSFEKHTIFPGPERVHCRRQLRSTLGGHRVDLIWDFCHTFTTSTFALIFEYIFNGKCSQNGSQKLIMQGTCGHNFGDRFLAVDFWIRFGWLLPSFGSRLTPFWLPLAIFQSPFNQFWLTFAHPEPRVDQLGISQRHCLYFIIFPTQILQTSKIFVHTRFVHSAVAETRLCRAKDQNRILSTFQKLTFVDSQLSFSHIVAKLMKINNIRHRRR